MSSVRRTGYSSSMPRFEKRITDEQIASARQRIAQGATLRSAAAQIPCAASTLSYRIRRAEKAEAAARAASDDTHPRGSGVALGAGPAAPAEQIGPLEILRQALQATKADQPDWTTRISAARTLA